jgi:hypothetical protein
LPDRSRKVLKGPDEKIKEERGDIFFPKYTIRIWCPAEPKELIRLAYMLNMDPGRWFFFFLQLYDQIWVSC